MENESPWFDPDIDGPPVHIGVYKVKFKGLDYISRCEEYGARSYFDGRKWSWFSYIPEVSLQLHVDNMDKIGRSFYPSVFCYKGITDAA